MHSWPSLHDRDCCLKACDLQGPNKQLSSAACNPSPVQVIENILDDDQDMEDMNLGRRAENEDKLMSVSLAVHALTHTNQPPLHMVLELQRPAEQPTMHGSPMHLTHSSKADMRRHARQGADCSAAMQAAADSHRPACGAAYQLGDPSACSKMGGSSGMPCCEV